MKASTLIARDWTLPNSLCPYFPLLYFSNVFVSMLTCAFISLNRALAVWNYRLAKQLFTWKKTILYYNLMWQFSVGMMLLPLAGKWGELGMKEELFICTIKKTDTGNPRSWLLSIAVAILTVVVLSR